MSVEDIRNAVFGYKNISVQPATLCGRKVLVTGMSTDKRNELFADALDARGQVDFKKLMGKEAFIIQECVLDPDTMQKVFRCDKIDIDAIGKLPPHEVDPLFKLAVALTGEDARLIEALAKNSNEASGPATNS